MSDFDMLDDAEEILQPLCLCLNQDFSRVGVGHHKGYIIYRIHRHSSELGHITGETDPCSKEESTTMSSPRPSFNTTIEVVFPPKHDTKSSTPTTWEVPPATPRRHNVAMTGETSKQNKRSSQDDDDDKKSILLQSPTKDPQSQCSTEMENNSEEMGDGYEEEANEQDNFPEKIGTRQQTSFEGTFMDSATLDEEEKEESFTRKKTSSSLVLHSWCKEWQEASVPLPTERGVGVMALLYKTQFVAAVGGGPYPIGPRNVVKLFITGSMWADRSVRVPDCVEALRLDHRLLIILTTAELRLHSFETDQCVFALPIRNDIIVSQGGILSQKPSVFTDTLFPTSSVTESSDNSSKNKGIPNTTGSGAINTYCDMPLVIDYSKKCLAFRSSPHGFSLVRYDTELTPRHHPIAELLATVPIAHQHTLTSLAMHLVGDIGSGRVHSTSEYKRWHIATSSGHATLIRIWRYYDKNETSTVLGDTATTNYGRNSGPFAHGNDSELAGYFVMVKEVRNESLPTPIFQMHFIGEHFLFCISQNILKIFFVGEREEPKPYDISTKDPSKTIRAQNNQSSLRHLGLVSAFFRSEWAACTCPLPLMDYVFLPKWVHATSGALRRHLLRGIPNRHQMNEVHNNTGREHHQHIRSVNMEVTGPDSPFNETQRSNEIKQNVSISTSVNPTVSTDLSALFSRCVSMQVTPLLGSANWIAKRYLGFGGDDSRENMESEQKTVGVGFEQREHTTMTDIAQSLVVWWEQPAYWQLDYMTNMLMRTTTTTTTTTSTTNDMIPPCLKCADTAQLYCVTCDGSSVQFDFYPLEGKVECSRSVAALSREE